MVASPDDSARQEDRGRKQCGRGSDPRPNQIQPHENKRDYGRGENLEEAFDPQMHDPPTPVFDLRKMRMLAPRQARTIKEGDGGRSDGEQGYELPLLALSSQGGRNTRIIRNSHNSRPMNSAICHARPRSTYSYP